MRTCSICGKATTFGRLIRHKHSGIWEKEAPKKSRIYKANLKVRNVDGKKTSVCTKCIKREKANRHAAEKAAAQK